MIEAWLDVPGDQLPYRESDGWPSMFKRLSSMVYPLMDPVTAQITVRQSDDTDLQDLMERLDNWQAKAMTEGFKEAFKLFSLERIKKRTESQGLAQLADTNTSLTT